MDDGFRQYVEAIEPPRRALFDRLHGLVLEALLRSALDG
jgi:hypothetical protein